MEKICILGAGSWGTAQSILLGNNGHDVTLWGGLEDDLESIETTRENKRYLPGVRLPSSVRISGDIQEAIEDAAVIVLSVPSQAVRAVCMQIKAFIKPSVYLVDTAKGLEIASGMRLSQVVADVLGQEVSERYAVLSGPSHAEEVARQIPTVVTVAAKNRKTAMRVQDIYMSPVFRVYTNPDVPGVEMGGALKNIVALATGIVHGLEYGDNTIAALMTRGLAEMTRMGTALGGDSRTFNGLTGMGDLVVTCCSQYSRNRRAGELIGKGCSLDETLEQVGMVVEGAHTARVVYHLAKDYDIDMPITTACYNILYMNKPPRQQVEELMQRRKKQEIEEMINYTGSW